MSSCDLINCYGSLAKPVETNSGYLIQNKQNSSHIYSFFQIGLLKFNNPGKHKVDVSFIDGEFETASLKQIRFTPVESLN